MTKQEAVQLVSLAVASFPTMLEKDMSATALLWQKVLNDIPYPLAERALIRVLSTAKFFPSIAEIREAAVSVSQPAIPSHGEAWEKVGKSIRENGGYYNKEKVLNALDPLTRKTVESIGFQAICHSENQDTIRAQFRKAYETLSESQKKESVVPDSVKQLTAQIGKALPEGK